MKFVLNKHLYLFNKYINFLFQTNSFISMVKEILKCLKYSLHPIKDLHLKLLSKNKVVKMEQLYNRWFQNCMQKFMQLYHLLVILHYLELKLPLKIQDLPRLELNLFEPMLQLEWLLQIKERLNQPIQEP